MVFTAVIYHSPVTGVVLVTITSEVGADGLGLTVQVPLFADALTEAYPILISVLCVTLN